MKIYIMKKDALEKLKGNLESVYNKYYEEDDNKWMWEICEGDPFEVFKEIPDFELMNLVDDISIGEVEFNNCKILYNNLRFISESQASDERLWAGLCNSTFYEYTRKRWKYNSELPEDANKSISAIKSRFFFSGGIRSGLYRNTYAKCWWVGRNTFEINNSNQYEKLDILGSNDISTKINDIFYSNNYSSNTVILDGIIGGIKHFNDESKILSVREHIRPTLQFLNSVGGGIILDCLTQADIKELFIKNVNRILSEDAEIIESDDNAYFDDEITL